MPPKASSPNGPPKLSDLLPKRIAGFLGERPTLPFESNVDFDALHAELIVALDPKNFVEDVHVRDIACIQWDILRMRNMRLAAIEKGLPDATLRLMTPEFRQAINDDDAELEEEASYILRNAARGSVPHRKFFNSVAAKAGVTRHMLNVVAYTMALPTINALDEAIAKAERRRDQILRDLERRHSTLAAMKGGSSGPFAPVVDIDPASGPEEGGAGS